MICQVKNKQGYNLIQHNHVCSCKLKSMTLFFMCSGYMAQEYVMRGHFSVKSDVYSFGVLVLEIVSGQKNTSFHHDGNLEDLLGYVC